MVYNHTAEGDQRGPAYSFKGVPADPGRQQQSVQPGQHNRLARLAQRGWSFRRIALELGVHRDTVSLHVRRAAAALGPGPPAESKPAISIAGSAGRRSRCEPLRTVILANLEQGLSAQRIWQDLTAEHEFSDSYQSVQRFVRTLGAATPLPFRRMECAPGEEAQIDFGRGAPLITPADPNRPGGKSTRRATHLFRIVLSCSRSSRLTWRRCGRS